MITIGIDPGKSGGIVFINGDKIIEMYKCPNTIEEMAELLEPYRLKWDSNINVTAYIEQVHAFPVCLNSVLTMGFGKVCWELIR